MRWSNLAAVNQGTGHKLR